MADPTADLAIRKKRLHFRAWHRGTREADFIIGSFVERHLDDWRESEIAWFESLLEETDRDILSWIFGRTAVPEIFDTPLLAAMQRLDYVSQGD